MASQAMEGTKWYGSPAMLHHIYAYHTQKRSSSQSVEDVQHLCHILERGVHEVQEAIQPAAGGTTPTPTSGACMPLDTLAAKLRQSYTLHFTREDASTLSEVVGILASNMAWLPEFGCALLALKPHAASFVSSLPRLDEVTLFLVALDQWEFCIHSSPGCMEHTSECKGHRMIVCGTINKVDFTSKSFLARVKAEIQRRENARKKEGIKGFQRNPAFVHAVVADILSGNGVTPPRGGFSDVGRHTGSDPRSTVWPLAREAFKAVLTRQAGITGQSQQPQILFDQFMAHMHLWLLHKQLQLVTPATADADMLTRCMQMLQCAATEAASLVMQHGKNMAVFEAACDAANMHLTYVSGQRELELLRDQQLPITPTESQWAAMLGSISLPTGVIPPPCVPRAEQNGLEAARARAARQLGSIAVGPELPNLQSLQHLLQQHGKVTTAVGGDVGIQYALRSVESTLYGIAVTGIHQVPSQDLANVAGELVSVVDEYMQAMAAFRGSTLVSSAFMQVELYSRSLLVVWVAYCLLFQATRSDPKLSCYGVPLHWQDLKHLVLGDQLATNAALGVVRYLSRNYKKGHEMFSLRDNGAATFHMAMTYGSAELEAIWAQEQSNANKREDVHWQRVRKQQEELKKLRLERDAVTRKQESEEQNNRQNVYGSKNWQIVQSRIGSLQAQVYDLNAEILRTEKPPPPVVHPLPKDKAAAMNWLFFLHMPPLLRHLSRFSFQAQQMLLPDNIYDAIRVDGLNTNLTEHYNGHQRDCYFTANPVNKQFKCYVKIWSKGMVPQKIGPATIDGYCSRDDGVWYPDGLKPEMAWKGSGVAALDARIPHRGHFDPFAPVSPELVIQTFTEKLPQECQPLQWALYQPGNRTATALDRGNQGIASQHNKPVWLSKPGYLCFTSMRAYPLQQLRKLCAALHQRCLPLQHPAVQTLVRQTLYHLGELYISPTDHDGSKCHPLSRTSWDKHDGVLGCLCAELQQLADELNDAPRDQDQVLLLGEMAAYLSDWHTNGVAVARQFAAMTSRAADQLQAQMDEAGDKNSALWIQSHVKQTKARMVSLLCYGGGHITADDAQHMLELMVLVKHGDVFLEDAKLRAELAGLRARCHGIMARRLHEILQILQDHQPRERILTAAAARVLQRLQNTDVQLKWQQPQLVNSSEAVASFEAVGSDGDLYSINLMDGTVLLDGYPPSRLPLDILQHPLYFRTFGANNFEVAYTGAGVLRTLKPVKGRFYDFYLAQAPGGSPPLVVTEIDTEFEKRLELLDAGIDNSCGSWGRELPVRLREMHSHWLSREDNTIVLRPKDFQQHATQFLIRCTNNSQDASAPCPWDCWRVPHHLQSKHWTTLHDDHMGELSTAQLALLSGSHVIHVLSKMEKPSFIHVYIPSQMLCSVSQSANTTGTASIANIHFDLPRFGLEFVLANCGRLESLNYSGFYLRESQQMVSTDSLLGSVDSGGDEVTYTLPGFQQYLVLRRLEDNSVMPGPAKAHTLVLVPEGVVSRRSGVQVEMPGTCHARLKVHSYEVHNRFGHLRATNILARLQLACLYAATGSLLPEPGSRMTGAQTAMQLVRQCWTNQLLSDPELEQLRSVGQLGGHLAPALYLLAYELELSSMQLHHYQHAPPSTSGGAESTRGTIAGGVDSSGSSCLPVLDPEAANAYLLQASRILPGSYPMNHKLRLSPQEELRVFGCTSTYQTMYTMPTWRELGQFSPITDSVPECPIKADFIARSEAKLKTLVLFSTGGIMPSYPLDKRGASCETATWLQNRMHEDLEVSWTAYHSQLMPTHVKQVAREIIEHLKVDVYAARRLVEWYLLKHVATVPQSTGFPAVAFRLMQASAALPEVGLLDLMSSACQPGLLQQFNPFLSETARVSLHQGVLVWLQLCVLEDKLLRLVKLGADDRHREALLQELLVQRTWDPAQHPQWLVFEAEGQLQIRPAQHRIAKHLMENPGAIAQLNMGEGKTRVILPMLALHWADGSSVVRLNFLSTLLPEAYAHLHQHLCASVLGRKLFTMPFNRDMPISPKCVQAMAHTVAHCQQVGGMLLVAPEHRLSLHLKGLEVWWRQQGAPSELLQAMQDLTTMPYMDILDESDELLHHRLQLVYAWGSMLLLPSRLERVIALQVVLHAVSTLVDEGCSLLSTDVAVWQTHQDRKPGSFSQVRLLAGSKLDAIMPEVHFQVAQHILQHPPHEMLWLKDFRHKAEILSCITNSRLDADSALGPDATRLLHEHPHEREQVLALRGLLACNLLQLCLKKRHLVDYGRSERARKRLAVPFRAAHTPAERAEYSQPDVALILTHLSVYHTGVTLSELVDALSVLLRMGVSAQEDYYSGWLQLSQDRIPAGDLVLVDDVRKLDTSNPQQMELMWRYFSHNMAVADFWLMFCVLQSETGQFPTRLSSSAWHLADCTHPETGAARVVGFSGTNDNHLLLPLQVHQAHIQEEPQLLGTNGKMLGMLLDSDITQYSTLHVQQGDKVLWQATLDLALVLERHALLDCGALLAGTNNRKAAEYVVEHLGALPFKGACFFDNESEPKQWKILGRNGACLPRHSSPIAERDTFTIFDDARCRGADLQLRAQAVGLLTLSSNICKDKLMQAAGRLRQLGRGRQTLHLVGTQEVTNKILMSEVSGSQQASLTRARQDEPSVRQVLQWVMGNTVEAMLHGVVEWAGKGLHFAATKDRPEKSLVDEVQELEHLYGGGRSREPVVSVVQAMVRKQAEKLTGVSVNGQEALVAEVEKRIEEYGEGHTVVAGLSLDEECERELEKEEEVEEEEEVQVPLVKAACETDWRYDGVLSCKSIANLTVHLSATSSPVKLCKLPAVAGLLRPESNISTIPWSTRVYCTTNFTFTTQPTMDAALSGGSHSNDGMGVEAGCSRSELPGLGEYLRPVDHLLLFPSGEVVLLSERETDGILEAMWDDRRHSGLVTHAATMANNGIHNSPLGQVFGFMKGSALSLKRPALTPALLLNLCYARQAIDKACRPLLTETLHPLDNAPLTAALQTQLQTSELVSMHLFNGGCTYRTDEQRRQLQQMVANKKHAAEALVEMRGLLSFFPRSDLEKASDCWN